MGLVSSSLTFPKKSIQKRGQVKRHKVKFISLDEGVENMRTTERNITRRERKLRGPNGTPSNKSEQLLDNQKLTKQTTPKTSKSNITPEVEKNQPKNTLKAPTPKSQSPKSEQSRRSQTGKKPETLEPKLDDLQLKDRVSSEILTDTQRKEGQSKSGSSDIDRDELLKETSESDSKLKKDLKGINETTNRTGSERSSLKDNFNNDSESQSDLTDSKKPGLKGGKIGSETDQSRTNPLSEGKSEDDSVESNSSTKLSGKDEDDQSGSGKKSEKGSEEVESEWSSDGVAGGDRFAKYDEERQEEMKKLLMTIQGMFDERIREEDDERIPKELKVNYNEDNYLVFRMDGTKHYIMHMTMEYSPRLDKYYAIMTSDDFVDQSRSVLYISKKRVLDQFDHLAGHFVSFNQFYDDHISNKRTFNQFMMKLEEKFMDEFGKSFIGFDKVINLPNYKLLHFKVMGAELSDGTYATNIFYMYLYKLNAKYFMIEMKGEVREMSMTVKAFLADEEFLDVIKKIVLTAVENNMHEFGWITVPNIIKSALENIVKDQNTINNDGEYLKLEQIGEEKEFNERNNIIQYQLKHTPGDDEDSDEEFIIDVNCYLYKDEFLPSIYFGVNSKVYESEYLVPFTGKTGNFQNMVVNSIEKAYNTIHDITYELALIDEQDVYNYDQDKIINMIKDKMVKLNITDNADNIKVQEVVNTEEDNDPYLEEKIYFKPEQYFTIHNIEMEEKRQGFLINCYNLESDSGDIGEYRIYAINYYDCKEDFEGFVQACILE